MRKTLSPFREQILLFLGLTCMLSGLSKPAHAIQQTPPENYGAVDDSSKYKTRVFGCANFGKIRCDSANGGGISGYADATGLFQCLNTGNIAGDRKIGGIAGYASGNSSDSGEIGHCFNSGLIRAGSSSGGLIGYSGENIILTNTYNIGNVVASQFKGAIVGRKFHSSTRISNCYYDKQSCLPGAVEGNDIASAAEGRFTRQMIGDSLLQAFGGNLWRYHTGYYPRPVLWDTTLEVAGATSPLYLQDNSRIDSVTDMFTMQQTPGMFWSSDDSNSVRITGNTGYILKNDSSRLISIGNSSRTFRQVPLLYTYRSVCHRIAFHANHGTGQMDTMEICGSNPAVLPSSQFTRTKHLFQGWAYSDTNVAMFHSGDTIQCSQDITLYAVWSPDGSDSLHAIPINSEQELMAFRDAVNNYSRGVFKGVPNQSTGFRGIHFMLTADMDLDSLYAAGTDWEPVGKSSSACFRGQFHGMGHSISNLHINTPAANYKGLFGYLDSALVEGVSLSNNDTIIGKQYCGGIAAFANNGSRILRCASHAYVEGASTHIGGICGNLAKSDIEESYNTGTVYGTEKVGGIAGYTNGNSSSYSHIRWCYNSGQIHADKAGGGICGNSYAYTEITQVYHNGQVWSDLQGGSLIGLKSQKSVTCLTAFYDNQISPSGAINGNDDSTATGCPTIALTGTLPHGFDSLHWISQSGRYPQLLSADSSAASCIAVLPVVFATGDNTELVRNDFSLSGCDWVQWTATTGSKLQIQNCQGRILGSDSQIVLSASYRQTVYRQILISYIQLRTICNVMLWGNDSANNRVVLQAFENSFLRLDTMPFQKRHQIFRGWSQEQYGKGIWMIGDSIWIDRDTNLYATWSNDGLSAEYALRIDSLSDWVEFRNAVNDYRTGCYQGVQNLQSGFCGIHFRLCVPLDLRNICDSLHAWIPVGRNASTPFRGIFDGNGFAIDHLVIDSANMEFAGIFGCIDSATITRLELGKHSSIRANRYVGGISGCVRNQSVISQCANHATIEGIEEYIGGICGYLTRSTIEKCYNAADISGKEKVGGITGYAGTGSGSGTPSSHNSSSVSYCYNSNAIYGTNCTGGLIGFLNGNSILEKGYNSGQLFGQQYTGSIVGRKYSSTPVIRFCFYDRQISPTGGINGKDADATEGRFTRQMTGNGLNTTLDSLNWNYTENFYPRLNPIDTSAAAWISAIPIYLNEPESSDRVVHDFLLGSWDSCIWISSDSSKLRIEGLRVCVADSDSVVCLELTYKGEIYKSIELHPFVIADGIAEHSSGKEGNILVYPNPTDQQLNIRTPESCQLQQVCLYDGSGRLLLRKTVNATMFHLDLSGLPAGTYRVTLLGKNQKHYPFTISKR